MCSAIPHTGARRSIPVLVSSGCGVRGGCRRCRESYHARVFHKWACGYPIAQRGAPPPSLAQIRVLRSARPLLDHATHTAPPSRRCIRSPGASTYSAGMGRSGESTPRMSVSEGCGSACPTPECLRRRLLCCCRGRRARRDALQRLHLQGQLGLLATCRVLVDNVALDILVDDLEGFGKQRRRNRVVTLLDSLANLRTRSITW